MHQAFWGIIGGIAIILGICWAFSTKSGRKFVKWSVTALCVIIGIFLTYDGIAKKNNDEQQYNDDIYSCEHDTWRYESAKVYYNNYREFYYDQNKVNDIGNKCVNDALNNSKARQNWWWVEAGGGIFLGLAALGVFDDKKENRAKKH